MNQSPDNSATGRESVEAQELVRLNYWCDQFELAWKQSAEVDLPEFLERVPEEERANLIKELVLIDIEIRQQRNLAAPLDRYLSVAHDLPRTWLEMQVALAQSKTQVTRLQELPPGHQLGDYTILSQLGSGGMGVVYRAEHRLMKRQVALKVIQHQNHLSQSAERRFEREVRAAAQLAHPNIVIAHDARQIDGWIYLVTELIEGEDLAKRIQRSGPLPAQTAIDFALQTARGLEYAHRQGIIHRDIKPANLLIDTQQRIKILDLGLARWLNKSGDEAEAALTSSFEMLGTAQFMAPEQARAASSADERSDIYSLGCTLFFMLTGRAPYDGLAYLETCMAHLNAPIPSAGESVPGIPTALDKLIQTWMAKTAEGRPASMTDAIEQLERLTQPEPRPEPWRPSRRVIMQSAVGASAVGLAAVGLVTARMNGWLGQLAQDDPASPPRRISDVTAPGLRLKGDGYLEVPDFRVPVEDHMAIEALVSPMANRSPANLVTWTGPKSFVLFCDEATRWGIAYFDGQEEKLILADAPAEKSIAQLVAAIWNGRKLDLLVDGQPIPWKPIPYELVPAAPRLYIGGIPDGVIPASQGPRYFQGDINAVRILQSKQPLTLAAHPLELTVTSQTVALFDFGNMQLSSSQMQIRDLTGRWEGSMHWM